MPVAASVRHAAEPALVAARGWRSSRIASIDIVRGAVMVLMAIDHVRVYSGIPAGGPTAGVFFTRWVTHFAAPAFVFLAGTAAFLHGARLRGRRELSRFLLARGVWLLLLEMTVIRLSWTFNLDFGSYLLAGVIWVIGWSMILMAALVFLPTAAIGLSGAAVIALHNLLPGSGPWLGQTGVPWLLQILYYGGAISLGDGGPDLVVLYTIVPWIGVMAAGYGFGALMRRPSPDRRRIALQLGAALIAAFLVLRAIDGYGDPRPWRPAAGDQRAASQAGPPPVLAFLNTSKYPASLLFLLMTLGPTILAIGLLERRTSEEAAPPAPLRALAVFGRVPLFYYLLHLPAIHAAALAVSLVRRGSLEPWLFENHPVMNPPAPDGYMWPLALLYLVTVVVVVGLYFVCRRFATFKERRRDLSWLTYI